MKVHIVLFNSKKNGNQILYVFSSFEKAQEHIDSLPITDEGHYWINTRNVC